jgi:hypothetical protein
VVSKSRGGSSDSFVSLARLAIDAGFIDLGYAIIAIGAVSVGLLLVQPIDVPSSAVRYAFMVTAGLPCFLIVIGSFKILKRVGS